MISNRLSLAACILCSAAFWAAVQFDVGFAGRPEALNELGITGALDAQVSKPVENQEEPQRPGRWHKTPKRYRRKLTEEQLERIKQLESMGYLSGSRPEPSLSGVVEFDSSRAYSGCNFYVSGHAPEAILIDMRGKVLHKWSYDFEKAWPDRHVPKSNKNTEFWRRAYLYKNGDILAIHSGIGMIKLDKCSNLIWKYGGKAHHDLDVMEDGTIYVLTREARVIPDLNEDEPIVEDFVTQLDASGNEVSQVSILRCLQSNQPPGLFNRMHRSGDVTHTNTLEILDGRLAEQDPAFRSGNALISILKLDTIAIVDLEARRLVWTFSGNWRRQHQPTVLDNGNILIFDNQGYKGKSKVMEFNPFTERAVWTYKWTYDDHFYSESCGSCQRLGNGNTLITESDGGRAFEVTPDKTIVWEYVSPHRAGENGEFIATLFELIRLPSEFPLDWIP